MKIDLNKKYRYRNGDPARILCVDAPGNYSVISLYKNGNTVTHDVLGRVYASEDESEFDLIEVREPLECWLWVQQDGKVDYNALPSKYQSQQRRLFREVIE